MPDCRCGLTAVIQLLLCRSQALTEFIEILLFLHRVLFDVSQCLAPLFELPLQIIQHDRLDRLL